MGSSPTLGTKNEYKVNLLVTGFGTFSAISDNPSAQLAKHSNSPFQVLEVSYQAVDHFLDSGEPLEYDAMLFLGYAKRSFLTPELYAYNEYSPSPDVAGVIRSGTISETTPKVLNTRLWVSNLHEPIGKLDFVQISTDPGRYLCNYIYYQGLSRFPNKKIGFLHVPAFDVVPMESQLKTISNLIQIVTV